MITKLARRKKWNEAKYECKNNFCTFYFEKARWLTANFRRKATAPDAPVPSLSTPTLSSFWCLFLESLHSYICLHCLKKYLNSCANSRMNKFMFHENSGSSIAAIPNVYVHNAIAMINYMFVHSILFYFFFQKIFFGCIFSFRVFSPSLYSYRARPWLPIPSFPIRPMSWVPRLGECTKLWKIMKYDSDGISFALFVVRRHK